MADWKRVVHRLNYTFLAALKEARGDSEGLSAVLGVPGPILQALEAADDQVLHAIAQVAVPLCRVQAEQIQAALAAAGNGDELRAKSIMLIRGVADSGQECARGG